jgi:hypothetical protein
MSEKRNQRTEKMEQNMAHVLEIWLANPLLSFNEIAEKAGISERTFARYRANEAFMSKYDTRCRERFKSLQAKAMEQMEILMEQGNWNATKYALDGNDYGGKQKLEINSTTIKVSVEEDGD